MEHVPDKSVFSPLKPCKDFLRSNEKKPIRRRITCSIGIFPRITIELSWYPASRVRRSEHRAPCGQVWKIIIAPATCCVQRLSLPARNTRNRNQNRCFPTRFGRLPEKCAVVVRFTIVISIVGRWSFDFLSIDERDIYPKTFKRGRSSKLCYCWNSIDIIHNYLHGMGVWKRLKLQIKSK